MEKLSIQKLKCIPTKYLVEELKKREGIETRIAVPHQDLQVLINGPAVVLIVTD